MPTSEHAMASDQQQHEMVVGPGVGDVGLAELDHGLEPGLSWCSHSSGMMPRCGSWISPPTIAEDAEHDERDEHDRRRLVGLDIAVGAVLVGVALPAGASPKNTMIT